MASKRHRRRSSARSSGSADLLGLAIAGCQEFGVANPTALKPGDLIRLLNSTPVGQVLSERKLRAHRQRAGTRIGDGRHVDLVRYAAWLFAEAAGPAGSGGNGPITATEPPQAPRRPPRAERAAQDPAAAYEAKKVREAARNREASRKGRNIGPIPAVADPARRAEATKSLRVFLETYMSNTFKLAWGPDHLEVIAITERVINVGGTFAEAMPRGTGKTAIAVGASLWAVLTGRRKYVAVIGATAIQAAEDMDDIKMELDSNELLLADFPEVCYPIHQLEGFANRCRGQHVDGVRTHMQWKGKYRIVLPTVAGSDASGAVVQVAGITGHIRGMHIKCADGSVNRPDLALVDDFQTEKSSPSPKQCRSRLNTINGAVMGLAGPGKKMSVLVLCTVMNKGDAADQILDNDLNPQFRGRRYQLIKAWPTNEKHWQKYADLRRASQKAGGEGEEATEYYRQRRSVMDKGGVSNWPARFNADELSAIQYAWNLRIDKKDGFFAEYQNQPVEEAAPETEQITPEAISEKINRLVRCQVPHGAHHVVGFIDVHEDVLYYVAAAFSERFGGGPIDYGTYPEQEAAYFLKRQAVHTLQEEFPKHSLEAQIRAGLEAVTNLLVEREYQRTDGAVMHMSLIMIDANYGPQTSTVYAFCRESKHAAILLPSHGMGVGASSRPFRDYRIKPGDQAGLNWRIPNQRGTQAVRHVTFDANYWKAFVHARFLTPVGDLSAWSLYGSDPELHQLYADHLTSEPRVRMVNKKTGREVDEFQKPKQNADNHWFDGTVGCAVAGAIKGCALLESEAATNREEPPLDLEKLQKQRMEDDPDYLE